MKYNIIVSHSKNMVIGNNNYLPWSLPSDMKYFKSITTESDSGKPNIVLMGFNTWMSIPYNFRPLKNRINVVLTDKHYEDIKNNDIYLVKNHSEFRDLCLNKLREKYNKIFIIGGSSVYKYYLSHPDLDLVYVTYINKDIQGNIKFPSLVSKHKNFELLSTTKYCNEGGLDYQFRIYKKIEEKHPEYQYLDILKEILDTKDLIDNRTKTLTKSVFTRQMRFNLKHGFPLLTTKKMFTKGVIEELLWFLNGKTDAKLLQKKGVKIWDGNSSREYLDSIGLTENKEGDCGAIYGFNFRHYGAKYIDCDSDYKDKGYDQVKECLRLIKEQPNSRRIIINLWNPNVLDKCCLPPCHVLYQFSVRNNELSCSMYQRSGDFGLGIPFNIASASLLTHIFAKLSGLNVGELVHTIADCHIYENHFVQIQEQLKRTPFPLPKLVIQDTNQKNVEDFSIEDFTFIGYNCYNSLKMNMVV